jgi:hypothetical protein
VVREGFPQLMRSGKVEFGELLWLNSRWAQPVKITPEEGASTVVLYFMEQQPEGDWRIDVCQFLGSLKAVQAALYRN